MPSGKNPMTNTKVKLIASLICEAATIDQQNRAIIFGIFSQINTPQLPATHPQFSVFTVWSGVVGEKHNQQLKIIAPSGKIILETPQMPFEIGRPHASLISQFRLMRFDEFGIYKVQIILDEKVENEIDLEVLQVRRDA